MAPLALILLLLLPLPGRAGFQPTGENEPDPTGTVFDDEEKPGDAQSLTDVVKEAREAFVAGKLGHTVNLEHAIDYIENRNPDERQKERWKRIQDLLRRLNELRHACQPGRPQAGLDTALDAVIAAFRRAGVNPPLPPREELRRLYAAYLTRPQGALRSVPGPMRGVQGRIRGTTDRPTGAHPLTTGVGVVDSTPLPFLDPALRERLIAIQSLSATSPDEAANQLARLLDGTLERGQISAVMAQPQYREALARIHAAARMHPTPDPALSVALGALDRRVSQALSRRVLPETPTLHDQLVAAFHTTLAALPLSASLARTHFQPRNEADPAEVARLLRALEASNAGYAADVGRILDAAEMLFGPSMGAHYHRAGDRPGREGVADAANNIATSTYGERTVANFRAAVERALKLGLSPFVVDGADRAAAMAMELLAKAMNLAPNQYLTPKHFPDARPEEELTEGQPVIVRGGAREIGHLLLPHLTALRTNPQSYMMGHTTLPDWERELRGQFPGIPSLCENCALPASLSPFILRGYLRQGLHYRGLIVSDWYDMGAVRSAIEAARPSLPQSLRGASRTALTVILATYAGVNWQAGLVEQYGNTRGPAMARDAAAIQAFAQSNPAFKRIWDELLVETALIHRRMNRSGAHTPASEAEVRAAALAMTPPQRLAFMIGDWAWESDAPFSVPAILRRTDFRGIGDRNPGWADLRSRGGVNLMNHRVQFLAALTGQEFPMYAQFRRDAPSANVAEMRWLTALRDHAMFQAAYRAVDWNSPAMREAYRRYIDQITLQPRTEALVAAPLP